MKCPWALVQQDKQKMINGNRLSCSYNKARLSESLAALALRKARRYVLYF